MGLNYSWTFILLNFATSLKDRIKDKTIIEDW